MDLRQLRHFAAVVELGSLSRAAQHLNLTQPALTRSVKALEDDIGTRLVERGSSGVVATHAGMAMYRHAKFMITEAERARHEVRLAAGGVRGALAIAIDPGFADARIHRAIGRLCAEQGPLDLTIREGFVEQSVALLRDGHVDLALVVAPANAMQSGLAFERLAPVRSAIFAGADHPLARLGKVTKAQLVDQRWAMLDRPHAHDLLVRYFAAGRQAMPRDVVRTDGLALMRRLVVAEGFLALLPASMLTGEAAIALPAPDMPIVRQAGLLHRAGRELRPLAAAFAALLRDACADDDDRG